VAIAGGTHNVVYVTTMGNSVYAFDADVGGNPLWMQNFNGPDQPVSSTQVGQHCGVYRDISGNIGIASTPAIDPTAGTIYFVARTVTGAGDFYQRLHAIDMTTGAERSGSPVTIQASVPGSGAGSANGQVAFDPQTQNQRSALLFSQGKVFIAWASHCDTAPYHGWIMAYDAASLAQVNVLNLTPNGQEGGVWQSGSGPVVDADGNLYYGVGNGDWDGMSAFGQSLIRVSAQTLSVTDYFTPFDWASTASEPPDLDLGSAGPLLLPGTDLLIIAGKTGRMYVTNRNNMGHWMSSSDGQIQQAFQAVLLTPTMPFPLPAASKHHIHGGEVYWNGPDGPRIYVWGENDYLKSYAFQASSQTFNTTPASQGTMLPSVGMPGGMLSISANGAMAGTGILWVSIPASGDANQMVVPGVLRAFDASDLTQELWNSTMAANDDVGNFAKFVPPTIANGRVYLATFSNRLNVYGLPGQPPPDAGGSSGSGASGSGNSSGSSGGSGSGNSSGSSGGSGSSNSSGSSGGSGSSNSSGSGTSGSSGGSGTSNSSGGGSTSGVAGTSSGSGGGSDGNGFSQPQGGCSCTVVASRSGGAALTPVGTALFAAFGLRRRGRAKRARKASTTR
jgi:hypothetical protein